MVIKKNSSHPNILYGKNGILLINLGTPITTKVKVKSSGAELDLSGKVTGIGIMFNF